MTRTLAVLPTGLAGLLTTLPALEVLAASGREVVAFASQDHVGLLRFHPARPELLPRLGQPEAERLLLRSTEAEEAVVLSGGNLDAWLVRSAGVPRRLGFSSLFGPLFLTRRVRRPRPGARPASADHRVLVEALGGSWPEPDPSPRLQADAESLAEAAERLARARIGLDDRPLVAVYPGTAGGLSGAPWPRGRFEELLREARRRGMNAIVLATTQDLWQAVRVYEETGKIHPVIGPDLRLEILAALLARLDLVVACDSWMLQLAAAVGTPTVGLFARDPRRWGPQGPGHRTIRSRRGEWLRSIPTETVVEAVEKLRQEAGDAV